MFSRVFGKPKQENNAVATLDKLNELLSWKKLMVTTRRDMKVRFQELERAREEDRRKMDAVLETVQQLSNSLQALQQVSETLGRPHKRFPFRRVVQEGSYCPMLHSGRHNSGQFRRSESYRRHDRHDFLDSRDDAIKGQMEELIKSMANILQTVRQLHSVQQLHYVGDYIMSQEHYQGCQGGYMSDKDRIEEPECQGSYKFYGDRIEENTECSKDDDEQNFFEAVIRPEMDFVKNQEPRVVVKTIIGSKTQKQPWSKQNGAKKKILIKKKAKKILVFDYSNVKAKGMNCKEKEEKEVKTNSVESSNLFGCLFFQQWDPGGHLSIHLEDKVKV